MSETHVLTLIPATIDNEKLTLGKLEELVQNPKKGAATKYQSFQLSSDFDKSPTKSHWVLLSRYVLPKTSGKEYHKQEKELRNYREESRFPYYAPKSLDLVVSIFMEYLVSGNRLFGDSPLTYTRCDVPRYDFYDFGSGFCRIRIGGFDASGLRIESDDSSNLEHCGLAASWSLEKDLITPDEIERDRARRSRERMPWNTRRV